MFNKLRWFLALGILSFCFTAEAAVWKLRYGIAVRCKYRNTFFLAAHGQSWGIYGDDLRSGNCKLVVLSPGQITEQISEQVTENGQKKNITKTKNMLGLPRAASEEVGDEVKWFLKSIVTGDARGRDIANDLGNIPIKITVKRQNGASWDKSLNLNPRSALTPLLSHYEIDLPYEESQDRNGSGAFTVRVERTDQAAPDAAPDLFTVTLQPGGIFALPRTSPLRLFFTVPVDLVGLRFPAIRRELPNSESTYTAQWLSAPRIGLLLTLEPWDFDRAKHAWPVPIRFQTGFHFLDLASLQPASGDKSVFSPAFLLGASFSLPLFGSGSQVATAGTLGIFYELDVRSPENGSHLLITASVNLFSFLGTKSAN